MSDEDEEETFRRPWARLERQLRRIESKVDQLMEVAMTSQQDIDTLTQNLKDAEGRIRAEIDTLKAQAPHLDFTALEGEVGQIAGIAPVAGTPQPATTDPGTPGPQPPADTPPVDPATP